METIAPSASAVLSVADQLLLDQIARQLDDPNLPTDRLLEMLAEVTAIAKRYECDFRLGAD
jgi:hypothetical protein